MKEPLLSDDDDETHSLSWFSCCRRRRRHQQQQQQNNNERFIVLRRLTELKAALRAKIRINNQYANAALEDAKKARKEDRNDDAILHMKRRNAYRSANKDHSQILINLEVRQVQIENDSSSVADALVQINALPEPPRRTIEVESPPPPPPQKKQYELV